jgi:hypothetical protein
MKDVRKLRTCVTPSAEMGAPPNMICSGPTYEAALSFRRTSTAFDVSSR